MSVITGSMSSPGPQTDLICTVRRRRFWLRLAFVLAIGLLVWLFIAYMLYETNKRIPSDEK